ALLGANTYGGFTQIQNGAVQVTSINNSSPSSPGGQAASSSLGVPTSAANALIKFGNNANAGSLDYIGTGETTDRPLDLRGTTGGGTVLADQPAGSVTPLIFTSDTQVETAGVKSLTLGGASDPALRNTLQGAIPDSTTSLIKTGSNTWVISSQT